MTDSQDQDTAEASNSKADDAALELIKQLITLASGVLALSAAFVDKLPKTPLYFLALLLVSWVALIMSLVFGLRTISTIVKSRLNNDDEWSRGQGKTFGRICQAGFLVGVTFFATFAFVALALPSSGEKGITITIQANDPRVLEMLKGATQRQEPVQPQSTPAEKKEDKGSSKGQ